MLGLDGRPARRHATIPGNLKVMMTKMSIVSPFVRARSSLCSLPRARAPQLPGRRRLPLPPSIRAFRRLALAADRYSRPVLAVTGAGQSTLLLRRVAGGVWKTDDAGRTETDSTVSRSHRSAPLRCSVGPERHLRRFGRADMRSTSPTATASINPPAGKTWHRIGLADTRQIGRIIVDPKPEYRVRRCARSRIRTQRGARCFPHGRWRRHVAKSVV